jgi:undecaprenyl-diphosphatase
MKSIAELIRNLTSVIELRVLAAWIAIATSIWIFLQLAGEVTEGDVDVLDRRLMFLLRVPGHPSEPIGPLWLQEAMRDVTALGGFTLIIAVTAASVLGLLMYNRRRHAAVLAGIVVGAELSSEVLKIFYDRARPELVFHAVRVYSQSFPSGHSTTAAATFFTFAVIVSTLETRRRGKLLALFLASLATIAVGISRVYFGVHWPSDVLAGWIVGASWAIGAWIALAGHRGTLAEPIVPQTLHVG